MNNLSDQYYKLCAARKVDDSDVSNRQTQAKALTNIGVLKYNQGLGLSKIKNRERREGGGKMTFHSLSLTLSFVHSFLFFSITGDIMAAVELFQDAIHIDPQTVTAKANLFALKMGSHG